MGTLAVRFMKYGCRRNPSVTAMKAYKISTYTNCSKPPVVTAAGCIMVAYCLFETVHCLDRGGRNVRRELTLFFAPAAFVPCPALYCHFPGVKLQLFLNAINLQIFM
jgi:hypothetical protein